MTAGLQIWDGVNYIDLDGTTRITRIIGEITTSTVNGSATVAGLDSGVAFYTILGTTSLGQGGQLPLISIGGTTVTWTFEDSSSPRATRVLLGVSS